MDRTLSSMMTSMPTEKPVVLKKPPVIKFPRRTPSEEIPTRLIIYVTPDKTTCAECECFPKESPYTKPAKLVPCLVSPLSLYELAASAVDNLWPPDAFYWSVDDVARWMHKVVGLPQYKICIYKNNIDGLRLLLLEDPSNLPKINIHIFDHIKKIVRRIHQLYSTEVIRFCRSIGLPPRLPLTHCNFFQSRTGPRWGIRRNWTRADILRWMKIIGPQPVYMDHWDLVWYEKPDFPKTMFARIPKVKTEKVPIFRDALEICNEYETERKFKLERPELEQFIWTEHAHGSPLRLKAIQYLDDLIKKAAMKEPEKPQSRLMPRKISLEGLTGKDLLLARRRMPKQKF